MVSVEHEDAFDPDADIFLSVLNGNHVDKPKPPRSITRIPKPAKTHKDYSGSKFYNTGAWKALRYLAFMAYGRRCMCCQSTSKPMHVDHIKPRSQYPWLELDIRNLQILCNECNEGKGAWDETDWRTSSQKSNAEFFHKDLASKHADEIAKLRRDRKSAKSMKKRSRYRNHPRKPAG